ncbi:MAG: hypothetical protein ACXV3F_15810 [Frankiaceae bacterium]
MEICPSSGVDEGAGVEIADESLDVVAAACFGPAGAGHDSTRWRTQPQHWSAGTSAPSRVM